MVAQCAVHGVNHRQIRQLDTVYMSQLVDGRAVRGADTKQLMSRGSCLVNVVVILQLISFELPHDRRKRFDNAENGVSLRQTQVSFRITYALASCCNSNSCCNSAKHFRILSFRQKKRPI